MPSNTLDWTKAEKKLVGKYEIEIEYVHHLKELYRRMHKWLQDEGFKDFSGSDHYETMYWQRDAPDGAQEHQIWWRCMRDASAKGAKTPFYKWFMKVTIQTAMVRKTDVMHQGKKWGSFKANTKVLIEGYIIHAYPDEFKEGFLKPFFSDFHKWNYKKQYGEYKSAMTKKTAKLYNEVKAFLKLAGGKADTNIYPPDGMP